MIKRTAVTAIVLVTIAGAAPAPPALIFPA
jgi:hypothetical protein